MRVLPAVFLAGCGPTVIGWWDLDRWQVERDGDAIERRDAGFAVWSAEDEADFDLLLRYTYDPVAFDLVPRADAPLYESSYAPEDADPPDPLTFGFGEADAYYTLTCDVASYRTTEMVLECPSPFADDAASWTWTLLR